jgi:AcrR family transcriptional regulator
VARPRDQQLDRLILDAAGELLATGGYESLTIDEVARRSGASRPSVYRRWPSRTHLAFEFVLRPMLSEPIPDTGSARRDLVSCVGRHVAMLESFDRALMADLSTAMILDDAFAAEVDRRFLQVGLRQVATIIERAQGRGEIATGEEVIEALENLGGALIYRIFMLHRRLDEPAVERLVDGVLRSVG